jgi:hypothetical protein
VLDLWPNTSQHKAYEPEGQTKYLNRAHNDSVQTVVGGGGAILASVTLVGLGAYLIDNVQASGVGGPAFTFAEANTAATNILARLDANQTLLLADIDAVLNAVVAGSELTTAGGSASTGSVVDLLKVLANGYYEVPAGSVLDTDGSTFNTVVSGSFDDTKYKATVQGAAFDLSNTVGYLSKWKAATFTWNGTVGAAITIYDNTGAIL